MSAPRFPLFGRLASPAALRAAGVLTLCLFLCASAACRPDDDGVDDGNDDEEEESIEPIPKRSGSVLVDGCSLDAGQAASLRSPDAKKTVSEVILLCLSLSEGGGIRLRGTQTGSGLMTQIGDLRSQGYVVQLGITAVDEDDDEQPADELTRWLKRPLWRQATVQALAAYAQNSDGLQVILPELQDQARSDLSAWVAALSARLRPQRRLGVFVPPSVSQPSDISGGDAYDLALLGGKVDRLRLFTVDAASGDSPGPTLDADWILQAAAFAQKSISVDKLDVAVPLYGIDFRLQQTPTRQIVEESAVSFSEASALATTHGQTAQGGDGEALHFAYKDGSGQEHEVWYEDSASILQGLRDIPEKNLPLSAGVIYVGLGGEDPDLWADLVAAQDAAALP